MTETKPKDDFRSTLRTIDGHGNRNWVYAEVIGGVWRKRRLLFAAPLLFFFAVAPWFTFRGNPWMQVDFFGRKLVIFGQIFWAHELPLFLTAILGTIIGIYALTAWGGRVFCGWLCPHNTILETIFRPLEQLIEGRSNLRRQLDAAGTSPRKILLKTVKWTVYSGVALAMSANCIAWVVSGKVLAHELADPAGHVGTILVLLAVGGVFAFNFGWFREQTCLIVCPYGRLQGVLLDKRTLLVGYDHRRGEPRGRLGTPDAGDCVNCRRCVQVCPTGIDIRDGLQLECIGCTACIDACDDQMLKVSRPKGLIRYTTEAELSGEGVGGHRRPFVYMGLALVLIAIAVVRLALRSDFDPMLMRGGMMNFTESGGVVQNYLRLRIDNKWQDSLSFRVVSETPGVDITVPSVEPTRAGALSPTEFGMFVRIPRSSFHQGTCPVRIRVESVQPGHRPMVVSFKAFGPEG